MKELDVLFEAFFEKQAELLLAGGWPQLEELLAQEDDVLFDWISGRNLPPDPDLLRLIKTLTNADIIDLTLKVANRKDFAIPIVYSFVLVIVSALLSPQPYC